MKSDKMNRLLSHTLIFKISPINAFITWEVLNLGLNNFEIHFDVVVKEVRDKLKSCFASNILGAFEILYGDRKYLYEMIKGFDSSFGEAYAVLRKAKGDMDSVRELSEKEDKEWSIRVAFKGLFHAARVAAMTYLAVENSRWGGKKRDYHNLIRKNLMILSISCM